jgi:heterotetrameric sarcosine oxidase gamma subunit
VVELVAKTPCAGHVPVTVGGLTLSEAAPACITSVAPYKGAEATLSAAMDAAHGMAFPAPGRTTGKAALKAVWTGRGQCFLIGDAPADASLAAHAALTDQSDGWAVLHLDGEAAEAVMARLTPLDLRASVFKRGHTARSEVAHMMAVVTRTAKGFEIMVMRSFARTAVHHIHDAMASVAAEAAL